MCHLLVVSTIFVVVLNVQNIPAWYLFREYSILYFASFKYLSFPLCISCYKVNLKLLLTNRLPPILSRPLPFCNCLCNKIILYIFFSISYFSSAYKFSIALGYYAVYCVTCRDFLVIPFLNLLHTSILYVINSSAVRKLIQNVDVVMGIPLKFRECRPKRSVAWGCNECESSQLS